MSQLFNLMFFWLPNVRKIKPSVRVVLAEQPKNIFYFNKIIKYHCLFVPIANVVLVNYMVAGGLSALRAFSWKLYLICVICPFSKDRKFYNVTRCLILEHVLFTLCESETSISSTRNIILVFLLYL